MLRVSHDFPRCHCNSAVGAGNCAQTPPIRVPLPQIQSPSSSLTERGFFLLLLNYL